MFWCRAAVLGLALSLILTAPAYAADCSEVLNAPTGEFSLSRPVPGGLTRKFTQEGGVAFEGEAGEPVYAALGGVVAEPAADGTGVRIEHGGGLVTAYAGLGGLSVAAGACVKGGTAIGTLGDGGELSFGLLQDGKPVDPLPYLQ